MAPVIHSTSNSVSTQTDPHYPLTIPHFPFHNSQLNSQASTRIYHVKLLENPYRRDQGRSTRTTEHSELLKNIMDHLCKHNNTEEQEDSPLLEPHLGLDGSVAAAKSFSRTKKFVPTRSIDICALFG